ncbi:alpha/beta hydrolase-fold protein [Porticoccaceae bacterium]|nr:alpha/beta hydrolase-fold protein [Porticoccaceae bacterium]
MSPKHLLLAILFFCPFSEAGVDVPFKVPRSEIISVQDSSTKGMYELYIKLPKNYSKEKRYPVVYMTDAMYSFQIVSGATRFPINFGRMENIMLVGISWQKDFRPDFSRQRDYTPTKDKSWKSPTGSANNHLEFIRRDVISYIENKYSVDPNNRTYVGNSLGGLFGAYILLTKPDTFQNYVLGSPSFWYDNEIIFEFESNFSKSHTALEADVYIAVGERETPEYTNSRNNMVELSQKFYTILNERGYKGLNVKFHIIPSANHATAFPTTAIQGLWWLHKS